LRRERARPAHAAWSARRQRQHSVRPGPNWRRCRSKGGVVSAGGFGPHTHTHTCAHTHTHTHTRCIVRTCRLVSRPATVLLPIPMEPACVAMTGTCCESATSSRATHVFPVSAHLLAAPVSPTSRGSCCAPPAAAAALRLSSAMAQGLWRCLRCGGAAPVVRPSVGAAGWRAGAAPPHRPASAAGGLARTCLRCWNGPAVVGCRVQGGDRRMVWAVVWASGRAHARTHCARHVPEVTSCYGV
jgi:hypothetical protein